ncbi:MAG: hypothetical protein FWH32_03525 [Clostridiales bacterium]|nr:hypothetical protein [Clostridiales bacterium]
MGSFYEIAARTEVLREYGTALSFAFDRFAEKQDDDNKATQLKKTASEAWRVADKLYACNTHAEVDVVKAEMDTLKASLLELNPDAVF